MLDIAGDWHGEAWRAGKSIEKAWWALAWWVGLKFELGTPLTWFSINSSARDCSRDMNSLKVFRRWWWRAGVAELDITLTSADATLPNMRFASSFLIAAAEVVDVSISVNKALGSLGLTVGCGWGGGNLNVSYGDSYYYSFKSISVSWSLCELDSCLSLSMLE